MDSIMHSMFHLPLPVMEKILRPIIVYLCLIVFLRLFGKRELAQLNPFDLVVLLSLSNTVQNAIIGDDNSVSGGIIGAFSLLAINWLLTWFLYRSPRLNQTLEGSQTMLIANGVVSEEALKKETLTYEELVSVLNKNGFNDPADVDQCVLEPNGTFFVKGKTPTTETVHSRELMQAIEQLTAQVTAMRAELAGRQ
ncbi:DUF421 domain-containing protein [Granulicella sp. S156]|jgi:uncharacterized membrane protein YcaP (DUF421 family)|uniref:DUF421 domain-containing protein n=1 Tax=Granulicella sp. S156 TaxID=1747224 RepID=UPI00131B013A|nr:YetF domain-containing protein [Granulicella sp. S156]